jgi:hypothetical protein
MGIGGGSGTSVSLPDVPIRLTARTMRILTRRRRGSGGPATSTTLARIRSALARPGLLIALAVGLALAVAGCGGAGSTASGSGDAGKAHARQRAALTAARRRRADAATPLRFAYRPLYALPAALRDPAFAAVGAGRFALLGGLDAADSSVAGIELAGLHGIDGTGALPGAQHDAQAAALGGRVFVFGGGDFTEYDHILGYDPASGAVTPAGALPSAQSDVAVTRSGATAYIVGGYDGTNWLTTIVAWRPGSGTRVVGRLPVGLRYAAVAVARGSLVVVGGSTPTGASDAVYRFDLRTHLVSRIGRLPDPVTHAGAATLGAFVYLVGGRSDVLDAQTAQVWSIDPATGRVRPAGRLPTPVSDAAVLTLGHAIVVAGGQSPTATQSAVGELVPVGFG